jgi:lysozyme family protein
LAIVLTQEGGYSNDPQDPGGPTNLGITQKDLSDWLGHAATPEEVMELGKDTAREIYRTKYWNPLRCGDLPAGIDLIVFEFGVNAGLLRSVKAAQKVLGVTEDDSLGPITIERNRPQRLYKFGF